MMPAKRTRLSSDLQTAFAIHQRDDHDDGEDLALMYRKVFPFLMVLVS